VGGVALAVAPAGPASRLALEFAFLVSAACLGGVATRHATGWLRLPVALVTVAAGLAVLARIVDLGGVVSGVLIAPAAGLAMRSLAGWTLVMAAIVTGVVGLTSPAGLTPRSGGRSRRWPLVGLVIGGVVLVACLAAPTTTGMLLEWSLGLGGELPLALIAVAIGLAVAGVPALARERRTAGLGLGLLLLCGNGLAASGLVLATLLGLALVAWPTRATDRAAAGG
jgi:hypothetical protein